MLVCHCNGVSDRQIRRSIREGASTTGEVASSCGAGAGCGGCQQGIQRILNAEMAQREPHVTRIDVTSTPPA